MDDGDASRSRSAFQAINHLKAEPARDAQLLDTAIADSAKVSDDVKRIVSQNKSAHAQNADLLLSADNLGTAATASTAPSTQTLPTAATQSAQSSTRLSAELASASASASASDKDTNGLSASGYGTRSRNRPGTSRPNYAEDTEMDFELTSAPTSSTLELHRIAAERISGSPPTGSDSRQSPAVGAKKVAAVSNGSWNSASKDTSIPGTSTFSANPNAQTSRKRKAAGGSNATNGHTTSNHTSTQTSSRKSLGNTRHDRAREISLHTFEKSGAILKDGKLVADDGTVFAVNDNVYLICEPPGEPYYLGRIMEFVHKDSDNPKSPIEALRCNWYYRPRDVQRASSDTRLLYGTMHSDICPITSLRGKCTILHRSEITDLDEYRRQNDCFWFEHVYDRFIHRYYEVIPTSQVVNVPEKVKKALDERWKYVIVEANKKKELTSESKSCKRCSGFCATNDSVDCALCHNTYHLNCVRPPLPKRPSRGFAWSCGPCSRAQERKLEARRTPVIGDAGADGEEDEFIDEDEEDAGAQLTTTAPSPSTSDIQTDQQSGSQADIAIAKMWPMRYLGLHCRVEDALQYDDRAIYPRASSRLGARHQANVTEWYGRPVELVKAAEVEKRYIKSTSHKKDAKLSKETVAALEADRAEKAKRPKWVQDEPKGYVRRGEDFPNNDPNNTAKLIFKMPQLGVHSSRGLDDTPSVSEADVDSYMERAKDVAESMGLPRWHTNFLDKAIELLQANNFDSDAALKQLRKIDKRKDLKEPQLTKDEQKRFEEGVAKYGSELRRVRMHVKTLSHADIVRYYYMWKKTEKGKEIWGSYPGRKGAKKKVEARDAAKLLDDIADDQDDSAFDNDKASQRKRGFQCKFCSTRKARQWRRAPGVVPGQTVSADGKSSKDKSNGLVVALCQRCAGLWRRYAIQWEEHDEVAKKVAQGGGRAWKRRIDEELIRAWAAAAEEEQALNAQDPRVDSPPQPPGASSEPPKKKLKGAPETDSATATPPAEAVIKKKQPPPPPPKAPTPPPVPVMPKLRALPCAVCGLMEPGDGQLLTCRDCRLTVHRMCYGVLDQRNGKWLCDMCTNDKKEMASYEYKCVLCPVEQTWQQLVEQPKTSHKKKSDRDREKERLEKELAVKVAEDYRQQQKEKGRPLMPREPLKRTADNNWVHVQCAVWTPETKFSTAEALEVVEGIPSIPKTKYDFVCKFCKRGDKGACVACQQCYAVCHVACAQAAGATLGFDVIPVKSTRRDGVSITTLGPETGTLVAAIWCREHTVKTIIHYPSEIVGETGLNLLQHYVRNYKQADLQLTGTTRKANLLDEASKLTGTSVAPLSATSNRRVSTTNVVGATTRASRNSSAGITSAVQDADAQMVTPPVEQLPRKCATCNIDTSPKWWKIEPPSSPKDPAHTATLPHDSHLANGVKPGTASQHGSPQSLAVQPVANGVVEHSRAQDADIDRAAAMASAALTLEDADSSIDDSPKFQCNKCHWKKLHAPEEPEEANSGDSQPPETQQPPRSPAQAHLPHLPWISGAGLPPQSQMQWPTHQIPMTNGVVPPLQPLPHLPHHSTYHPSPYAQPQPNGYVPVATTTGYSAPPISTARSPFPQAHAPAPLHYTTHSPQLSGLIAGLPSPHAGVAPHSPTYPGILPHRQTESPFSGPPQHLPPYGASHSSPVPMPGRPSTPRDAIIPPAETRVGGGASASPSLRNLLH